jgi:hypothetical protein
VAAAPTRFDTSRVSFGEMVAAVSAVVLIIVMFLPWYGASAKLSIGGFPGSQSKSVNFSAWQAYGFRDIVLFLIALLVLGYVVLRALDALPASLPFDAPLGVLVLGGLAAVLVVIGILHIPDRAGGALPNFSAPGVSVDHGRKFWIFVGFLATLGIAYGGWAALMEGRRRISPAAAGPGGTLSGPGAVPPPGPSSTAPPAASTPSEPATTPLSPTPSAPAAPTPPASESGSTPGAAPGTAPAATGGAPPAPTPPVSPPVQPQQPTAGTQANPPADWYPDPHGQARLRWWDGSQWTDQTAD